MSNDGIVVGYDGSAGAETALRWALEEATRHRTGVHLVCVVERPLRPAAVPSMPGEVDPAEERDQAVTRLDRAVAGASAVRPDVDVTSAVLEGPPATVLCEQSKGARMLILGRRARRGLTRLFAGSVSQAVATHALCPVIVVRGGETAHTVGRPVAVGVDESAQAQGAIGFAIDEAATRGVGLLAVRAWTPPHQPWRSDVRPLVLDVAELETAERHVLTEALRPWRETYAGVPVTTRLISSDPRHALVAVSRNAQLLVVGSRGHGGFEGLLLGSVSHYLLHHAGCPVGITRDEAASQPARLRHSPAPCRAGD